MNHHYARTYGLIEFWNTSENSCHRRGILTIAIADAFSDALGVHISEESDKKNKTKEIRESTFATFIAKFLVAMTFAIPVLMFESLLTATIVSAIRGLLLLSILS